MAAPDVDTVTDYLSPGASLQGGNFVIESLLAAGAFGATYLARDHLLNRPVVIKEYFPEGCRRSGDDVIPASAQSPESFTAARDHFLKEAQVLAQFHHPGIVGVYNFFEANNTAYMVMEYLQGPTLLEVLTQYGVLPPDEVLEIARQICDALKVVHHAGMLHRDIKPNNAIWCDDGRVVLVDFGLSEKFDDGNSRHTRPLDTALRFGTPGYAPLEQYTHSAQLGPRSDIYALGATLYHLATGIVPIPATDRACGVELELPHCAHPVLCECIMWAMSMEMKKRPALVELFWNRLQEADATLSARTELLGILINRKIQKVAKARADALKKTEEEEAVDDGGCIKMIFFGYLTIWAIAAAVCAIFLFVRYVLVGG
jgi:serine/threonine-protein kinase